MADVEVNVETATKAPAKKAAAKRAPRKTAAKKAAVKESPLDALLNAVEVARAAGVTVQGTAVVLTNDVTTERNL